MEEKRATEIIHNDEMLKLLELVKKKDEEAIL